MSDGRRRKRKVKGRPEDNPNTNCLANVRCPRCGSYGPFMINANAVVEVYDDGTGDASNWEWDDDSIIRCRKCNNTGVLDQFYDPPVRRHFVVPADHIIIAIEPDGAIRMLSGFDLDHHIEIRDYTKNHIVRCGEPRRDADGEIYCGTDIG